MYAGGSIETMNLNSKEDFEFNCVLIYYRIRKGNGNWQTNLYGVLFLEEVSTSDFDSTINVDNERGGYIQRYPKFKKGNSWGLKLDLKIDAQPDSQMELRDKLYDDPNEGTGMQMFIEALMQLNDCVKIFYDVKKENTDIEERLYTLENMVSGVDTVYELRNDVGVLRTKVEMFQPRLDLLEGRIDNVEDRISKLETNLGYLINDVKKITSDINPRIFTLENNIKDNISGIKILEDKFNNLNILIDDSINEDEK
jgi:archaellum component FlaC